MLPRRLLPWLFALTLLFGQAAAFAHALGHLQTHDSALPDKVCEVCVAQAHLGNAAPAPVPNLPLVAAAHAAPDISVSLSITVHHRGAWARAPPAAV